MAKKTLKTQLRKQQIRNLMEKRGRKKLSREDSLLAQVDNDYYGTTVDASYEDYELFNFKKEY